MNDRSSIINRRDFLSCLGCAGLAASPQDTAFRAWSDNLRFVLDDTSDTSNITITQIGAARFSTDVATFATSGYAVPGDGGEGIFTRAPAGADLGKLQSADGTWWILTRDQIIRPELFGDVSQAAINAALRFSPEITLTAGRVYAITSPINPNAENLINAHGATIVVTDSFSGTHMLGGAAGLRMLGGTLDGSALPAPTGPWSGEPIGTILVADGRSGPCNGGEFVDVVFTNCPTGVAHLRHCGAWRFARCRAVNVQTYKAALNNAVFEVYGHPSGAMPNGGNDHRFEDCVIDGYNWKGFNMGNTMRARDALHRPRRNAAPRPRRFLRRRLHRQCVG